MSASKRDVSGRFHFLPVPHGVPIPPARSDGGPTVHLLVFELAGRQLALPAALLREVVRTVAVAPLPRASPIVEGVINVRGALVPVLDIRRRFGLAPRPLTLDQHLIIARAGPRSVALRVDRALDLVEVGEDAIESAAGLAPAADYVAGIAKLPDGLLIIHDLERFLSLDEGRQIDAAVAERMAGSEPAAEPLESPATRRKESR